MVENMEENILSSSFAGKQLNVINNQHIYNLIEVNKIVAIVLFYRFNILLRKFFRRNIKHCFFGIFVFNVNTNCVPQMCFSQTYSAKNQQWVEGSSTRFVGNC